MKIDLAQTVAKTPFSSAQKDLFSLTTTFIKNENLKKLLFYQTADALCKPKLTNEQTLGLLHKNIKVVPKLRIEEDVNAYIVITFDNFVTNSTNPEFRDNIIMLDILCHIDSWVMDNYQLRPYLIMSEIDAMLNNSKLDGIGRVEFMQASQLILTEEIAGFGMVYRVVNDAAKKD